MFLLTYMPLKGFIDSLDLWKIVMFSIMDFLLKEEALYIFFEFGIVLDIQEIALLLSWLLLN